MTAPQATASRPGKGTARGPVLLLVIACLGAVAIGAVIEGWVWVGVAALTLSLVVGTVLGTTIHPRT